MIQPARPDILWVVTTQWRAQSVGYAGDANARTPALDRLAARAINYAQAVTPHPFGPFARAALLTGRPSPGNGVRDYFDPLPSHARTIAHELGERGYATAFFGKWHLSARDPGLPLVGEAQARLTVSPAERGGFAFWEGFEGGFQLNNPWLHGTRIATPRIFPGYQADVVCSRAAAWLAEHSAGTCGGMASAPQPWFALVSLEPPHPPYGAPAAGIGLRDANTVQLSSNVPRGGAVERQARRELAGYHAHIEATDRAVGALLAAIDAEARRRNRPVPIVVFTSMHGDMHGAHGLFRKGWPHEESVRVPLLVRIPAGPTGSPGQSAPGERRDDGALSLLQLPAMTIAWADAAPAPRLPPWAEISMPSVVRLPHQCDRAWRGIRTRSRKLIVGESGSPWLFFDLERDPGESINLAADPGRRGELEELRRNTGI